MPRRPSLGPALVALCALAALTACNGSPEAGRPNTTPTSSSTTTSPSPNPSAPSTPTWTAEEQAAITAAKARYLTARAATGKALEKPEGVRSPVLEAAGNGGAWLQSILARLDFFTRNGLYQSGTSKIVSSAPTSVDLSAEQPTVVLKGCIDGTGVQMRYRATGKPVPVASTVGDSKHSVNARFVYAPNAAGKKIWFLIEEKAAGAC
jgi:hypothetical protein